MEIPIKLTFGDYFSANVQSVELDTAIPNMVFHAVGLLALTAAAAVYLLLYPRWNVTSFWGGVCLLLVLYALVKATAWYMRLRKAWAASEKTSSLLLVDKQHAELRTGSSTLELPCGAQWHETRRVYWCTTGQQMAVFPKRQIEAAHGTQALREWIAKPMDAA